MAGVNAMLRFGIEEGPEAVAILSEKALGRAALPEEKERWRNNDCTALSALFQNMMPLDWNLETWPAMDHLLPSITVPCLLYAGEKDPFHDGAKEAAKHIQHAGFFSVPGLEHTETFEHSELVLPHAKRFLSNVTAKEH